MKFQVSDKMISFLLTQQYHRVRQLNNNVKTSLKRNTKSRQEALSCINQLVEVNVVIAYPLKGSWEIIVRLNKFPLSSNGIATRCQVFVDNNKQQQCLTPLLIASLIICVLELMACRTSSTSSCAVQQMKEIITIHIVVRVSLTGW